MKHTFESVRRLLVDTAEKQRVYSGVGRPPSLVYS